MSEISLMKFNKKGLEEAKRLFDEKRMSGLDEIINEEKKTKTKMSYVRLSDLDELVALAFDEKYTSEMDIGQEIDKDKKFEKALDLGRYLNDVIPYDSFFKKYRNDIEFWTWLSFVYLKQLCDYKRRDDRYHLKDAPNYILKLSSSRDILHLALYAWGAFGQYGETNESFANFFLYNPPHRLPDFARRLYNPLLRKNERIIELLHHLYFDKKTNKPKIGCLGKRKETNYPGSIDRLIEDLIPQLDRNYDLKKMSVEQILKLLPKEEFNKWKHTHQA